MNKEHFVFLRKGTMIVPQSLDDAESGEVIKSLIQQKFDVSRLHVWARNNREALERHTQLIMANNTEWGQVVLY